MEGLKTVPSEFGPEETMSRIEKEIMEGGMRIFARINHAALAKEVGQTLLPTDLIIFGNPRGGAPLMQARQTIGIDLPLKALVWQGESGRTWLSYNLPHWLVKRHELKEMNSVTAKMELALAAIALKATRSSGNTPSR